MTAGVFLARESGHILCGSHDNRQHNFASSGEHQLNVNAASNRKVSSLETSPQPRETLTAAFAPACAPRGLPRLCFFAQLRKERGLGEETAQRLAERETAVRELTKRLREAEKAAAAATAAAKAAIVETRGSPGVRQVGCDTEDGLYFEAHTTRLPGANNTQYNEQTAHLSWAAYQS